MPSAICHARTVPPPPLMMIGAFRQRPGRNRQHRGAGAGQRPGCRAAGSSPVQAVTCQQGEGD